MARVRFEPKPCRSQSRRSFTTRQRCRQCTKNLNIEIYIIGFSTLPFSKTLFQMLNFIEMLKTINKTSTYYFVSFVME